MSVLTIKSRYDYVCHQLDVLTIDDNEITSAHYPRGIQHSFERERGMLQAVLSLPMIQQAAISARYSTVDHPELWRQYQLLDHLLDCINHVAKMPGMQRDGYSAEWTNNWRLEKSASFR